MPIKLEIPDSQIPAARQLYAGIAQEKWEHLLCAQREWEELLPILKKLEVDRPDKDGYASFGNKDRKPDVKLTAYDPAWSWNKKSRYVILRNGPLSAKRIVEIILSKYEPEADPNTIQNSVPSTLSVNSRAGRFKRLEIKGEFVYDVMDIDETIDEFRHP